MIRIAKTSLNLEREPFLRPFGFKGGFLSECWQIIVGLESENGARGVGTAIQSVLWSDADVFTQYSEVGGNTLMLALTNYALNLVKDMHFETPVDVITEIAPKVWEYGKYVTGKKDLRQTFALNALVALDCALWQLYARENGLATFDDMIPAQYSKALSCRHSKLASIPLMSYGVPMEEIKASVDEGYFFLKIKIGSDPDKDGDREKMLQWDMQRLKAIHECIGNTPVAYTESGRVPYYLDANGRYDSIERLQRLVDFCDKIGMREQIAILEEPFPEDYLEPVGNLGVRIAADESAHSDADARARIDLGYSAITLKPIAKTLSMTLRIADIASSENVPMFCADLTVNPLLVDWNKNFAARIPALPGLKVGVVETNGHQNYVNWHQMGSYHPKPYAPWSKVENGCFTLDDEFYACSGGILQDSEHYSGLVFK